MMREELTEALGGVADRHITAALRYDPDGAYASGERSIKMGERKHIKRMAVLALAAALLLARGPRRGRRGGGIRGPAGAGEKGPAGL